LFTYFLKYTYFISLSLPFPGFFYFPSSSSLLLTCFLLTTFLLFLNHINFFLFFFLSFLRFIHSILSHPLPFPSPHSCLTLSFFFTFYFFTIFVSFLSLSSHPFLFLPFCLLSFLPPFYLTIFLITPSSPIFFPFLTSFFFTILIFFSPCQESHYKDARALSDKMGVPVIALNSPYSFQYDIG
jgi:hypothetical protein